MAFNKVEAIILNNDGSPVQTSEYGQYADVQHSVLPDGASTSALQTTGNNLLGSIDTKTPALVSGRTPVDGSGVTQPISATQLPLPSGAATETTLASINAKIPALVQNKQPNINAVQGARYSISEMTKNLALANGSTTTIYSYSGTGIFYRSFLSLSATTNLNLTLTIDGQDVISDFLLSDLTNATAYKISATGDPKVVGFELSPGASSTILLNFGIGLIFNSNIQIKLRATATGRTLKAGYATLVKES